MVWFGLISDLNHRKKVFCFFVSLCFCFLLSNIAFASSLLGSMNLILNPKLRKGKKKNKNKIWNKISRLWLLAMRSMCSNLRSGICPISFSNFSLFTSLLLSFLRELPPSTYEPRDQIPDLDPPDYFSSLTRIIAKRASCPLTPIDQSCRSRASTLRVYTLNVQTAPLI